MRAKIYIISKVLFLIIFLLGLTLYAFPSPLVLAVCPTGPGGDTGGYIGLETVDGQTGFLSTFQDLTQTTDKFSTSGLCITDPKASIPQFSVPTYDEMKSLYFDQYRGSISTSVVNKVGNKDENDISLSSSHLYHITKSSAGATDDNLTISSNIPGPGSNIGVVFVDGNLLVKTTNHKLEQGGDGGLVFVVKGNIYIDHDMGGTQGSHNNEINAVFISYGQFCSSSTGSFASGAGTGVSCEATGTSAPLLTIKGSVIYLNSTGAPNFVRSNGNNNDPAEQLIYDPKYLVILKDIFSKDLTIWKEIQ